MTTPDSWGSDVPISMPEPVRTEAPGRVKMYGFVYTDLGLFSDLNADDHERMSTPGYGPHDLPTAPVVEG